MKETVLIVFVILCLPLTGLFALELAVFPQKVPVGGMNLSQGVVVVHETGDILSLSPDGSCSIIVPSELNQVTVDVYVPGFEATGGVFNPTAAVRLPLALQSFVGDEIIFDLGETAAKVLAARSVIDDATEEAADSPRTLNPNVPLGTETQSLNPFIIIETIVGKSMAEILGLDKK